MQYDALQNENLTTFDSVIVILPSVIVPIDILMNVAARHPKHSNLYWGH
jgi:hypothetical protein